MGLFSTKTSEKPRRDFKAERNKLLAEFREIIKTFGLQRELDAVIRRAEPDISEMSMLPPFGTRLFRTVSDEIARGRFDTFRRHMRRLVFQVTHEPSRLRLIEIQTKLQRLRVDELSQGIFDARGANAPSTEIDELERQLEAAWYDETMFNGHEQVDGVEDKDFLKSVRK